MKLASVHPNFSVRQLLVLSCLTDEPERGNVVRHRFEQRCYVIADTLFYRALHQLHKHGLVAASGTEHVYWRRSAKGRDLLQSVHTATTTP
jgi:DNA-binding PadR family transcriptional regulator